MERKLKILSAIILIGFVGLGTNYIVSSKHKVLLQDIQLKDTSADLKQLQLKYDMLNTDLDKQLHEKNQNAEEIKRLNEEKIQLENQKKELEVQVQAKAAAKQAQQVALQNAARSAGGTGTAYAAPAGDAKAFIYSHESGNNPGAINRSSGACGLGQALPCSKMPCSLSDYACQDNFFTGYMIARYGSWENARAFWLKNSWW